MKITNDDQTCVAFRSLNKINVQADDHRILVDDPGIIGDGGNSGFQALNIAVQFGASKIILVGFDMRIDRGVHWHGNHANGLINPGARNVMRWRRAMLNAVKPLLELGVEVVNASPDSAMTAFPKMTIGEALKRWGARELSSGAVGNGNAQTCGVG